jgi:hypothetical protein
VKETDKTPAEARQQFADSTVNPNVVESKPPSSVLAPLCSLLSLLSPFFPPKYNNDGRRKQYIHLGS